MSLQFIVVAFAGHQAAGSRVSDSVALIAATKAASLMLSGRLAGALRARSARIARRAGGVIVRWRNTDSIGGFWSA
jgi:hypothetical protein